MRYVVDWRDWLSHSEHVPHIPFQFQLNMTELFRNSTLITVLVSDAVTL